MGRTDDRLEMLDGQLPGPARPDAAVIDQALAAREHLRPGGTLVLLTIPVTAALAAGIAVGPGRAAARVRAAVVLLAE